MKIVSKIYYLLFFVPGILFSQDPPDDFEFNQSTQQGFYFFLNIDILGEELNENIRILKHNKDEDISYDLCEN